VHSAVSPADGQPSKRPGARWVAAAAASAGAAAALSASNAQPAHANAPDARKASEPLTLYQYEVCPWCNKVKATLDYRSVPYRTVEVHPLFKSELKWSEYKKVPILVQPNGDAITESTKIVDFVFEQYADRAAPVKKGCRLAAVHLCPERIERARERTRLSQCCQAFCAKRADPAAQQASCVCACLVCCNAVTQ
jgi:glutaredoxin